MNTCNFPFLGIPEPFTTTYHFGQYPANAKHLPFLPAAGLHPIHPIDQKYPSSNTLFNLTLLIFIISSLSLNPNVLRMNHLLVTLCLLLAIQVAYTQSSRLDSLTQLIENTSTDNDKAKLLLQRSRIAPPVWTVAQAMGDAQRALALYQQRGED